MSIYLVKVTNDLIEQSETLLSLFISLTVELPEIRDRGKHHTHMLVGLGIPLLETQNYMNF